MCHNVPASTGSRPPADPDETEHGRIERLQGEIDELRQRMSEAEETIRAIRQGEVDAFVVTDAVAGADRVFTLETAEHPYRRLVEAMHQAAITVGLDGTILYANRAFARAVQQPGEAIVARTVHEFLTTASRPVVDAILARRAGGRGEVHLRRDDGSELPVRMAASDYADEEGVACLILTDLTDQRRLEEVIAAETLSRSILEQAVDAIVVGDPAGLLIRAGGAARRLCGRDPIGLRFDEAFALRRQGEPPGSRYTLPISRVVSGETIRGLKLHLECADSGRSSELLLSVGPLRDSEGFAVGFVATLTDVTELRRAEEALREADRRKDEFLATLAHELRNPLGAIRNAAQLASRVPDDRTARHWAQEVIERQARHLGHLVDDLLDVSRISLGKIELRREVLDARVVLERAAQTIRTQVMAKRQTLDQVIHDAPLPVDVDPTRFEQILVNLLTNASKYTDEGGRITLAASPQDDALAIRVEDTGIGIARENLGRIFELFGQVDHAIDRSRGGLGIGLTLVRQLVEMHGGTVHVDSEGLGRGSVFQVRLPLHQGPFAAPTGPGARPEPRRHGPRVLLVDDNVDGVSSLAWLLEQEGFEVVMAHDGQAALEAARAQPPAVVLLDIGLPGMDGHELARRLRQEPCCTDAMLIAISGYSQPQDRERSRAAGCDHHLVKPVELEELIPLLTTVRSPAD